MVSEKLRTALLLLVVAFLASGTRACQDDYCVGCNANIGTPTPTVTRTRSPTTTRTSTATVSTSPTSTATVSADGASTGELRSSQPLTNRLGKIAMAPRDSDSDGYVDSLELSSGSSATDPRSTPLLKLSSLQDALAKRDDIDGDGIAGKDEERMKLRPAIADSDGDGCTDGAELLSRSNALNAQSVPGPDADRDCLSDEYERAAGLNPGNADTDSDLVADSVEVTLGIDAWSADTDGDGILDWREIKLGSDTRTKDPVL